MTDTTMKPAVWVKPLVWEDARFRNSPRETAESLFGTYEVLQWAGGDFGGSVPASDPEESETEFGGASSIEEAKATAQANYEARILPALDVMEPTALVKAALERAATVADRTRSHFAGHWAASLLEREFQKIRALADDPEAVAQIIKKAGEDRG